ncbi:hypothetical protein [Comamonas flocculans]|uniref:Uncharacterized protein n=1 Tax=Comamonas flocculans TaxID=2597701 RepID=A0A5B8RVJ8_9BURK|nr:hypothetical protein [Comamonas flocculans]QEA12694.1 hypothetical protein FOZ74_06475 [Comamonas flocculans]
MTRPRPATPSEIGDGEDHQVDVHDPQVPPALRRDVLAMMQPGDTLWRCPRLGARRGGFGFFGTARQDVVIEWWLLDAQGELIEAFWEES